MDQGGCDLSDNPIVDFGVWEKYRFEGDKDFGSDSSFAFTDSLILIAVD